MQGCKSLIRRIWPYKILPRDDDDIKADLLKIMRHFGRNSNTFDVVVFVPNAGIYLARMFVELFGKSTNINFVAVRRISTVSKDNFLKELVFRKRWLASLMRHVEVFIRLVKFELGIRQKMVTEFEIDFDVKGKTVLVIDDSVETGTTLRLVKKTLLERGVSSVITACISKDLIPDKVDVEYSVYRYALLRTKNSRDYYAT